jgi:type IV conjugative transfer system protein TraL
MSYDRNVILRYLDNPTRIAFWTLDEMGVLFIPIALGCIFSFPILGMMLSVSSYMLLKYIKQNIGGGFLKHVLYWYLPGMHKSMKIKIPSHVREYIG